MTLVCSTIVSSTDSEVVSQPKEVFPVYVWAYLPQDRKEMMKQAMKTAAKKEVLAGSLLQLSIRA